MSFELELHYFTALTVDSLCAYPFTHSRVDKKVRAQRSTISHLNPPV